MQSVGTDGRVFHFLVLQLNTTDLASSEGTKNLVWADADQLLYQHFWCRPVIRKRAVVVSPATQPVTLPPQGEQEWGGGGSHVWGPGFRSLVPRTSDRRAPSAMPTPKTTSSTLSPAQLFPSLPLPSAPPRPAPQLPSVPCT